MKIKINTIKNILVSVAVVLSVLLSKTIFFGVINRGTYQWIFWIYSIIVFLTVVRKKHDFNRMLLILLPFILLFITNVLFHYSSMTLDGINTVLGYIITFFVVGLLVSVVSKQQFSCAYCYFMGILAVLSILCFGIANISPSTAYSMCQSGYDWKTSYGYSMFYTWGWNGFISSRNAGPFWEPGAFQGFLLIALCMLLFKSDENKINERTRAFMVVLFIITIITTGSTTGYILLILLIVLQRKNIEEIFIYIPKKIRILTTLIGACLILYIILSSGNITDKILGTTNQSSSIRYMDVIGGIRLSVNNPIMGLGVSTTRDSLRTILGISSHDSSGLTEMAYTFGIPFLFYYVICMFKGCFSFFAVKKNRDKCFFSLILLTLNLTEGIWFLPVYLYMVLYRE